MKRFTSILAFMAMALMSFTFVSCDDDDDVADTLWGVWQGDMHTFDQWNGQYYESHDSEIAFDRDPYEYASGSGYWVDFYSNAPWDYFASRITWTVDNGTIIIYSHEDDTYFYISDYTLSENYFRGTIESEWGDPMDFRLRKVASPRWNYYDHDWGWGDWGYYTGYSSRGTRAAEYNDGSKHVRGIGNVPDTTTK